MLRFRTQGVVFYSRTNAAWIATVMTGTLNVSNHYVRHAILVGGIRLLGNGFQNVPCDQPATRNIRGMTANTWRAVIGCAARDMALFPTLCGMVGTCEFKLNHRSVREMF